MPRDSAARCSRCENIMALLALQNYGKAEVQLLRCSQCGHEQERYRPAGSRGAPTMPKS
jgi:hypothetical protein